MRDGKKQRMSLKNLCQNINTAIKNATSSTSLKRSRVTRNPEHVKPAARVSETTPVEASTARPPAPIKREIPNANWSPEQRQRLQTELMVLQDILEQTMSADLAVYRISKLCFELTRHVPAKRSSSVAGAAHESVSPSTSGEFTRVCSDGMCRLVKRSTDTTTASKPVQPSPVARLRAR